MISKINQDLVTQSGGGAGCGCCRIWKKLNKGLGDDELKGLASAVNYFDRNAAIQCGEFPLIVDSQPQEDTGVRPTQLTDMFLWCLGIS